MIATESNANAPHDGKSLTRPPPMRQRCPRGSDGRQREAGAVGARINNTQSEGGLFIYRSIASWEKRRE